jgi:hypothetical protein
MRIGFLGYDGRRDIVIRGHVLYSDRRNHERRHNDRGLHWARHRWWGCGGIGSNFYRSFQREAMIQGVVVSAVNWSFEICHERGGLLEIQVGLNQPCKVRRANVTSRGR